MIAQVTGTLLGKELDKVEVMTAGGVKGQVDGFYKDTDGQPVAVPRVHERVAYLLGMANRGQPGKIAGLLAYARDLARLGLLYLKGGTWSLVTVRRGDDWLARDDFDNWELLREVLKAFPKGRVVEKLK